MQLKNFRRYYDDTAGKFRHAHSLVLVAYDINESPDVAKEWGVMTLPTIFLLDPAGTIRYVNNGLIVAENLQKQLEPMIFQRINSE
jgi:hypothetical protein